MPGENGSSGNNENKKKSGKRWMRDLGFFGAGFVAGSGVTVAVGVLTDKVKDVPYLTDGAAAAKK